MHGAARSVMSCTAAVGTPLRQGCHHRAFKPNLCTLKFTSFSPSSTGSCRGNKTEPAALITVPWPNRNTCSSKSIPEGVRCTLLPTQFSILHGCACGTNFNFSLLKYPCLYLFLTHYLSLTTLYLTTCWCMIIQIATRPALHQYSPVRPGMQRNEAATASVPDHNPGW